MYLRYRALMAIEPEFDEAQLQGRALVSAIASGDTDSSDAIMAEILGLDLRTFAEGFMSNRPSQVLFTLAWLVVGLTDLLAEIDPAGRDRLRLLADGFAGIEQQLHQSREHSEEE